MSIIRLTIAVEDIADVIAIFDQIKVYRSTDDGVSFPELTGLGTRIDLVAGQSLYEFLDVAGDESYQYKTSYFNSGSSLESSLSGAFQGATEPLYISVEDVRAEGVLVSQASDTKVLMLIRTWQEFIDRVTGQFFTPKNMVLDRDGNGTKLLQLPWPIISISSIYLNEDFANPVDLGSFEIYAGRGGSERDDRKNPRIKLRSKEGSIFTGTGAVRYSTNVFETGEKNQRIVGTFGYVEADGCTPDAIRYAMLKLVSRTAKPLGGSSVSPGGPIVEEETDRHKRRYADPTVGSRAWSVSGDTEVDQILAAFRGPIKVGAPRTMNRRLTGGRVLI